MRDIKRACQILLATALGARDGYILAQREVEYFGILQHDADLFEIVLLVDALDGYVVKEYVAFETLVFLQQQFQESGFSRSGEADDADALPAGKSTLLKLLLKENESFEGD